MRMRRKYSQTFVFTKYKQKDEENAELTNEEEIKKEKEYLDGENSTRANVFWKK